MITSRADAPETKEMAKQVNGDWAGRCPEIAKAFCERRGLTEGFCAQF